MMKEHPAYDNLPAKQSRWEISIHNARDLLGEFQRPSDNPPAISRAAAIPARRQLTFSSKRTKQYQRDGATSPLHRKPTRTPKHCVSNATSSGPIISPNSLNDCAAPMLDRRPT
jgi:hypothetical protein